MNITKRQRAVYKEHILKNLNEESVSSFQKYRNFFVGNHNLAYVLKYELICMVLAPMPGALGLALRKWFYPSVFKRVGSGVLWGRNITIRHPGKIQIGNRVAIDDDCMLDAKGAGDEGVQIGNDVLIARGTIIQGKCSWVRIGDSCIIGSQSQLTSPGGISLGRSVGIAGQCYIGGGRYPVDNKESAMIDQPVYSKGPVIIEDDVSIGAGVIVQDGVRIGKGCMIGSGAIVREDVPEYTVVAPYQKLILLPRGDADGNPPR